MATHSSVLAWRIPGIEEPRGLLSMGSHRVGQDWSHLAAAAAVESWNHSFSKSVATPPPNWPDVQSSKSSFTASLVVTWHIGSQWAYFCTKYIVASIKCMWVLVSRIQFFRTSWTVALQAPRNFPGKNTRVGCHFLLQGIFLTQGLNLCLLHILHW